MRTILICRRLPVAKDKIVLADGAQPAQAAFDLVANPRILRAVPTLILALVAAVPLTTAIAAVTTSTKKSKSELG